MSSNLINQSKVVATTSFLRIRSEGMNNMSDFVSLVIPAFNEADMISVAHAEIRRVVEAMNIDYEFLEGQTTVAVNGAAGTGKTIIACERAKQLADAGENVLFLCYNLL